MKKIGIIGGLGPESTFEYYKGIIDAFKDSYEETGFPEIIIDSLDLKSFLAMVEQKSWESIVGIIAG